MESSHPTQEEVKVTAVSKQEEEVKEPVNPEQEARLEKGGSSN